MLSFLLLKNNPVSYLTLYKKAENTETEFVNVELKLLVKMKYNKGSELKGTYYTHFSSALLVWRSNRVERHLCMIYSFK